MNIERLEKIKEFTEKIEYLLDEEVYDNTSLCLKGKINEFSEVLEF